MMIRFVCIFTILLIADIIPKDYLTFALKQSLTHETSLVQTYVRNRCLAFNILIQITEKRIAIPYKRVTVFEESSHLLTEYIYKFNSDNVSVYRCKQFLNIRKDLLRMNKKIRFRYLNMCNFIEEDLCFNR